MNFMKYLVSAFCCYFCLRMQKEKEIAEERKTVCRSKAAIKKLE